jgi:hypothetical protein
VTENGSLSDIVILLQSTGDPMVAAAEKLLVIVCPACGEKDLVPFAANGLVGRCNACSGAFVIQGEIVPVGHSCAIDPTTGLRPVAAVREPNAVVHIESEPQLVAALSESAAPEAVPASKDKPTPLKAPKRFAARYVAVAAGVTAFALVAGRIIFAPSDNAATQRAAISGTLPFPLSEKDNGYAWNRADEAARLALCQTLARTYSSKAGVRTRDAKWFYDSIHSFYNANPQQAPILSMEISQPVRLGMLTDKSK